LAKPYRSKYTDGKSGKKLLIGIASGLTVPTCFLGKFMTLANLRVVQGADRGRVYLDLKLPFTVGREEGNAIQLNDERISRFHVKVQEDNQYIVLTDLDSTNGTRVNGQDCQLRILRFGDLISVGRSVLLYGSREQIIERVQESLTAVEQQANLQPSHAKDPLDFEVDGSQSVMLMLANATPDPKIPERMTPSQAAQLAELLEHLHSQLAVVVDSPRTPEHVTTVKIDIATWQLMIQMYARLSELIRSIAEPEL
jgi:pSer/pThr/pTyr-binding forkhead associated (FHA) protein